MRRDCAIAISNQLFRGSQGFGWFSAKIAYISSRDGNILTSYPGRWLYHSLVFASLRPADSGNQTDILCRKTCLTIYLLSSGPDSEQPLVKCSIHPVLPPNPADYFLEKAKKPVSTVPARPLSPRALPRWESDTSWTATSCLQ